MNSELDNRLIGINIAYYRKLKKYTQMELAQETNISLSYMAKIESGLVTGCVSLPVLYRISKILEVSLDKLVNKNWCEENEYIFNIQKNGIYIRITEKRDSFIKYEKTTARQLS